MPEYKNIRVTRQVYDNIANRQLPRESISQALERLLADRLKFEEVIENLNQLLYGDK